MTMPPAFPQPDDAHDPSLGLLHDAPLDSALQRLAADDASALPHGALERLARSTTPMIVRSAATTRPPFAEADESSRRGLHTPRLAASSGAFRLAAGVGVAACVLAALLAQRGVPGPGAGSSRAGTQVASGELSASDTALLDALFPVGDDASGSGDGSGTTSGDDLYAAAASLEDGTSWDFIEWASEATQRGAM